MKESQSRSYPEQQTKPIGSNKTRGLSWTMNHTHIHTSYLVTVSDTLLEYRPEGMGSYWASTICATEKKLILLNCSQSPCFANLKPLTFCHFRCFRRRGCLKGTEKIWGRRRQWKRRWKSEFAFFQSSSRLLQVTNFVKCRRTLLKLNS